MLKDLPRLPPGFGKVEIPRVDLGIFGRLADISSTYIWVYVGIWAYSAGSWIYCIHIFGYMWAYMVVYGHIRQVGGYMVYIYLNILEFTIFLGIFGMLVEMGT